MIKERMEKVINIDKERRREKAIIRSKIETSKENIKDSFETSAKKKIRGSNLREELKFHRKILPPMKKNFKKNFHQKSGLYMYDAINPKQFITKARRKLKRIDRSFDECFSYAFKGKTQAQKERRRKMIRNSALGGKGKGMPKFSTKNSIAMSIRTLRKMKSVPPKINTDLNNFVISLGDGSTFGKTRRVDWIPESVVKKHLKFRFKTPRSSSLRERFSCRRDSRGVLSCSKSFDLKFKKLKEG